MSTASNGRWNVAEVVVTTGALFVVYRLMTRILGVEVLGVWSLVAATTSIGRAFDLGAAGGLTRFVALGAGDARRGERIQGYVDTAVLLNLVLYAVICLAMYWPADLALRRILQAQPMMQAHALLPLTLTTFALSGLSSVIFSALIGLGKSYQKSAIYMASNLIQLPLAYWAIQKFGLIGLGYAQIAAASFQVVLGWIAVSRLVAVGGALRIPSRFQPKLLKELLGFGAKFQMITLLGFLHEPAVRYVFTAVGGLAMVGYYEMASRCVNQVRSVVSAPAQNLTPLFVAASEGGADLAHLYDRWVVAISAAALVAYAGLGVCAPLLGLFWVGRLNSPFVLYTVLGSVGALVNIVSIPAFYLGIGGNRLLGNILGTAITTVTAPVAAFLLGRLLGGPGLVGGAALGLALGALVMLHMNTRQAGLRATPRLARAPDLLRESLRSALRRGKPVSA